MKKILITGESKGIGLECVKTFLSDGWQVICCLETQVDGVKIETEF